VVLVVLVLVTTNAKARGVASLILVLVVGLIGFMVEWLYGWAPLVAMFPLLKIHMNMGFYVLISSLILFFWVVVVFGIERLTHLEFLPGAIRVKEDIMERVRNFVIQGSRPQLYRLSDDILVHKLLGLGTGDLKIGFETVEGHKFYELRNVWNAGKVAAKINELIAEYRVTQTNHRQ